MPASRRCRTRRTQKQFIDARAAERGLRNVEVITRDANVLEFPPERRFDRVVSVEMFEHMRNYETLLGASPAGCVPGHALRCTSSRTRALPIRSRCVTKATGWRAILYRRHHAERPPAALLPAGPCDPRPLAGQRDALPEDLRAWLANMDRHRALVMPVISATYGERRHAAGGSTGACSSCPARNCSATARREWLVSHYLFERA